MIGAILLGLFCGIVARLLVPGDAFRNMSGPASWLVSLGLGLLGALVGYSSSRSASALMTPTSSTGAGY
jgi:uncharacterized membrane protein YeaQ/YmgE (transglycosylase-associated protein family)